MEMKMLKLDEITPNPLQPREAFDREKLKELADTVSDMGVLQPILVRPKENRYEIIAGERRWKASQIAGKREIPAIIKDVPDEEVMVESLIENVHREDLNPIERGRAIFEVFREQEVSLLRANIIANRFANGGLSNKINAIRQRLQRMEKGRGHGLTKEEEVIYGITKKIGLPLKTIYNTLDILNLPKPIQEEAAEKVGDTAKLAAISRIKEEEIQEKTFRKVVDEGLSQEETSEFVSVVKKAPGPVKQAMLKPKSQITPEIAEEIMEIEREEDQEALIKAIEREKLSEEKAKDLTTTVKQSPELVRKAMLKPKSKITPERAEQIIREFPEEEHQKQIIAEIEKLEEREDKGIELHIEERAKIARGERAPEIEVSPNSDERLVDNCRRVYRDIKILNARHAISLPEKWKAEYIRYMKMMHGHLERELKELGEIKYVETGGN